MTSLIAFAIIIGFIVALGKGLQVLVSSLRAATRKAPPIPKSVSSTWQPPSCEPTFAKRKYLFSAAERSVYEILCRIAPDHTVFAKVRLADLVRVQAKGREFWTNFNSISSKHVDFVFCDPNLAPVAALELDDASHDKPERMDRDELVDRVLKTAALPLVRVRAKHGYVLAELRQLLAPHVKLGAATVTESPDAKYMPPKGWRTGV